MVTIKESKESAIYHRQHFLNNLVGNVCRSRLVNFSVNQSFRMIILHLSMGLAVPIEETAEEKEDDKGNDLSLIHI